MPQDIVCLTYIFSMFYCLSTLATAKGFCEAFTDSNYQQPTSKSCLISPRINPFVFCPGETISHFIQKFSFGICLLDHKEFTILISSILTHLERPAMHFNFSYTKLHKTPENVTQGILVRHISPCRCLSAKDMQVNISNQFL